MASYTLNEDAVAHARQLIKARQYVLQSDWGDVQPRADDENAFLESHSWDDYAKWHLGLTDGEQPSGATRTSSLRRMSCCSYWMKRAPDRACMRRSISLSRATRAAV